MRAPYDDQGLLEANAGRQAGTPTHLTSCSVAPSDPPPLQSSPAVDEPSGEKML